MKIDIRNNKLEDISRIRVADPSDDEYCADSLFLDCKGFRVQIEDGEVGRYVSILSKEHAENLILGIKKAIELKWFDK